MQKNNSSPMEILLRQMDFWYKTPLGSQLFEAEKAALDKRLPHYRGEHLLQLGGASESFLFEASPILHRVRFSPEHSPVFRGPSVQGEFYKLPFLPESVDVMLLPHLLEFVPYPEKLIKESCDILAPEGRLMVLGFNPISLWGLSKYLNKKKTLPWRGNFIPVSRVKKWLSDQGLTIEETRTLFFRPPYVSMPCLRKLISLELMGQMFWSGCGAVYLIVAKKKTISLIKIEERLSKKKIVVECLEPIA